MKFTPEYLKYIALVNLSNNTKFYFGESLPKYISTNVLKMINFPNREP